MPTINQLVRENKRISKKTNLKKTPALECNPQKHGTCISVFTKTPRKPNSALRKVAKVRLTNNRIISVYIPGEGHNISRFSDVLVSGRRIRDLPGVKYGALRGKFDLSDVSSKRNGRSKYGRSKEKFDFIELKKKQKRNRNLKNRFYYKAFCKMYLLSVVGTLETSAQKKYWLKAHFYFNLLLLNNKSKGFDFRGHFHQKFKGLLAYLNNYKEDYIEKYSSKYPYKILFVNSKVLIVKDLEKQEVYRYDLKKN
jgi:small subunit ribosomal protein S12